MRSNVCLVIPALYQNRSPGCRRDANQRIRRYDLKEKTRHTSAAMTANEPVLDAAHAAFFQIGVSMGIAACTSDGVPVHVRAIGCRISADRRQVTMFVPVRQAEPVLRCIQENGAVAAVFTEPSTHRTVQVKARDAQRVPILTGDLDLVDAYREAFIQELERIGFQRAMIGTLIACPPDEIVAIRFTPIEAYSQTPGPKAGAPLEKTA
jgi:hypothetical protein